ncbi:fibropellin-3-like [Parasteatoda tepidariorum]|uniref:fibropellin-3-like n=1 Tax=Parasteatoda tepidariorum TaxID=114398 RepID=UPI0039BC8ECB
MLFSMIPLVKMSTKLTKPVIFVILIEGFLVKYTFLTRCNFHITKPKGIISTPNFPNAFPTPINCQWIIEAPFDTKVAVYFTQFYLKRGFTATEYSHYVREIRSGVGRLDFGAISASSEPTYLVSNQRILVLNMRVRNLDNIHLRVREHLIDVFGFNITYELIKKNESIREDLCINHHCSFTGYCLASSDFDNYSCGCFANHFGDECQYDDDCGPTATSGVCQNGGTCRYYIGSSIRTCECLPGYTGAKCEEATTNEKANGLAQQTQ